MSNEPTIEVRKVGPYRVVSSGRTIATYAGKVRAEKHASKLVGAIVQGREVPVLSGLGDGR